MKTTKHFLITILVLSVTFSYGQNYMYVNADSGLTIREKPEIGASKLGKLLYNEAVEIIEKTGVKLVVLDDGNKVSGEWVKMNSSKGIKGYIFNGFLSEIKMAKDINIKLPKANIYIKNLSIYGDDDTLHFDNKGNMVIEVDLGDLPENKTLFLKNNTYRSVKILQCYKNSVTIMNEGSHCDLTDWKHYYSDWKPVKEINKFKYEMLSYTEIDWEQFIPVEIDDLKKAVLEQCGEDWVKHIENVKNVNEYPAGVSTGSVLLKFILTDKENNITEKTIEFIIPMGC